MHWVPRGRACVTEDVAPSKTSTAALMGTLTTSNFIGCTVTPMITRLQPCLFLPALLQLVSFPLTIPTQAAHYHLVENHILK